MVLSIYFCVPAFVAMVTFGACVLMGIPLETGKVLCALATFRQMQAPIHGIPDLISIINQTKVSLDRISSFMCLEELPLFLSRRCVVSCDPEGLCLALLFPKKFVASTTLYHDAYLLL